LRTYGAGEDGAAEDSEAEEVMMVGVKLSEDSVVAPELLVVAETELGATTDELGTNGIEVVVVVHSDVVAVAVAIVVVYCFKSPELAFA
jgi:hypothetical protein